MAKTIEECFLYGIVDTGYVEMHEMADVTARMIDGGVDIIQLRAKELPPVATKQLAEELQPILESNGIPFIINDHPQLAAELGVGCHVGQDDLPVTEVRRIVKASSMVGKSTHSVAQAKAAVEESPDYIGFGPLFATPTKPDYQPIGTEDIRQVHEALDIPIFCIGGIKLENLENVIAAGAKRVVIVSGILQAQDIPAYCREVKNLLAM